MFCQVLYVVYLKSWAGFQIRALSSFFIADKAVGAKGFRAIWTEVKEKRNCGDDEFRCRATEFCISKSLKCNGINNCGISMGVMDKSDETDCE